MKVDEEIANFDGKIDSDNISMPSNDKPQLIINKHDHTEPFTNLTNEIVTRPKVNTHTQSRTERIWDQFTALEEQVFQNEVADPRLAFIDHLIRLQDEDAENAKKYYLYFLDIFKKNKDIFKNKIFLSYLKCRKKMQVDFGVYMPNIAQGDIDINHIPLNSRVLPKKLIDLGKKYNKTVTDHRNILYKSRCIANGVAFINRNPVVKEGLYWELKRKLSHPLEAGYKKGAKTLSDVFIKHCYIIGEQYMKQTGVLKKKDNTLKQIIKAIQNPPSVKSLVSVYSISHLYNTFGDTHTRKRSLRTVERSITQVETVQPQIANKLKSDKLIDISSSESEDGETCTIVVKSEKTTASSAVGPELKFVDDLIKYKDKEYEELKKDYIQLTEKYSLAGAFDEDFDIDSYLECREKIQIASGMYIPNYVYPDICPSDAKFYESCFESGETHMPEILQWSMTSDVEQSLFKSKCIATGLSIINKDFVLKRQVYQRISLANKVSENKSLKMLSLVLEEELNEIGRAHLGLKPSEVWPNKYDILSKIISGIKNVSSVTKILLSASIYSPDYDPDSIKFNNVNDPVTLSSLQTLEGISDNNKMILRSSDPADIMINIKVGRTCEQKKKHSGKITQAKRGGSKKNKCPPRCIRELNCIMDMPNISEKTRRRCKRNLVKLRKILQANKSKKCPRSKKKYTGRKGMEDIHIKY